MEKTIKQIIPASGWYSRFDNRGASPLVAWAVIFLEDEDGESQTYVDGLAVLKSGDVDIVSEDPHFQGFFFGD